MNNTALPPIFVSHGSPMIALEPGAAGAFMERLGPAIDAESGRPKAILAVPAPAAARAPVRLPTSVEPGVIGLDACAFGPLAARLAAHFELDEVASSHTDG